MRPLNDILYALAIPSFEATQVTPQGFAPGLLGVYPAFRNIVQLPNDIGALALPRSRRLARRKAGLGEWLWSPVNIENLLRRRPTPLQPFMVVFTADRAVARAVSRWRRSLRIAPLHVSTVKGFGAISPDDLTVERLRTYCKKALLAAKAAHRDLSIAEAQDLLEKWSPWEPKPFSLRLHSHNATNPNEMVLYSVGEGRPGEEGVLNCSPEEDYIAGIRESVEAVRALDDEIGGERAVVHPDRPDLVLLAPSMSRTAFATLQPDAPPPIKRAFRALDRQRGYFTQFRMEESDVKTIGPYMMLRGAELKIQTAVVGMRATSTLAATVRLPPAVTRAAGVVRALAGHMRHYDDRLPDTKTARVLRTVQDALSASVPSELDSLIRRSRSGVKIVGDAPMEWYPVDGLPLGLRSDVSRIDTAAGNFAVQQLRSMPPIYIPPRACGRYLMCTLFEEGDNLAEHARDGLEALGTLDGIELEGLHRRPTSVEEFVTTVNAYDGPILIVDGHGRPPEEDEPGGLIIGGRQVDVWTLSGRLRPPPVVILSACDTHPYDRSHATVANGFLACGAIAVLATSLPVRSIPAAAFLMGLMARAVSYGEAINRGGKAVAWSHIVGGALRMQLVGEVIRGFIKRGHLSPDQAETLLLESTLDLHPQRLDWFERLAERCRNAGGFDDIVWRKNFNDILAASDVIRYVQVGNPESILLADKPTIDAALAEAAQMYSGPGNKLGGNTMLELIPESAERTFVSARADAARQDR